MPNWFNIETYIFFMSALTRPQLMPSFSNIEAHMFSLSTQLLQSIKIIKKSNSSTQTYKMLISDYIVIGIRISLLSFVYPMATLSRFQLLW